MMPFRKISAASKGHLIRKYFTENTPEPIHNPALASGRQLEPGERLTAYYTGRDILGHRAGLAGLEMEGFERLSAHALRVGFITEAYDRGVRDEDIMRHTRHRDLRTMRDQPGAPGWSLKARPASSTCDDRPPVTAYPAPWDADPASAEAPGPEPLLPPPAKSRGRRPAVSRAGRARTHPAWLYHHLTITGAAGTVQAFAAAARGSGVVPWQIDGATLEEDVFNLAVAQPPAQRRLTVEGCRILAWQLRDRAEARQARAAALVGQSWACPFDLHALLPVPDALLQLGPNHPQALAWLRENWGTADKLRHVAGRPDARPNRRLPKDHAVLGYGFFISGDTPRAAVAQLAVRWPALGFVLRPRPG